MGRTIDLFIKSWANDYWLLAYALRSIAKNLSGYHRIVLLIPEKDKHIFDTRGMPPRTEIHYVKDEGIGYLRQQMFKLNAYRYSNSDFILFADSDCFFHRPIDLQELIKDGTPELLYTDYNLVEDAICWKEPTSRIMGEEVHWETMRRNCQIVHRSTLKHISEWNPNLEQVVMNSGRFSEFNLIGSFIMKYESTKYKLINTAEWQYTEPLAIQVWSHGKPDGDELQRTEWSKTQKVIKEVFNEDI